MPQTTLGGKELPEEDNFWAEDSFAESMSSDDSEVSTNG